MIRNLQLRHAGVTCRPADLLRDQPFPCSVAPATPYIQLIVNAVPPAVAFTGVQAQPVSSSCKQLGSRQVAVLPRCCWLLVTQQVVAQSYCQSHVDCLQVRKETVPWFQGMVQPWLDGVPPPLTDTVPPEQLADFDSKFVTVDGVRLHYKEAGSSGSGKPTVLLMHGLNGSTFSW